MVGGLRILKILRVNIISDYSQHSIKTLDSLLVQYQSQDPVIRAAKDFFQRQLLVAVARGALALIKMMLPLFWSASSN